MPRIFISYRRADSISATGRLHDFLESAFGEEDVFKDVEDIPPGVDFREHLRRSISECDVVLVVIGNRWANITDENGEKRLFQDNDFVRAEVAAALHDPETVTIPVLIEGARNPAADQLPENIRDLAYRNAFPLRNDPDFTSDVHKLIDYLRQIRGGSESAPASAPAAQSQSQTQPRFPAPLLIISSGVALVVLFVVITSFSPNNNVGPTDEGPPPVAESGSGGDNPPPPPPLNDPGDGPPPDAELFYDDLLGYGFDYPGDWTLENEYVDEGDYTLAVEGAEMQIVVYELLEDDLPSVQDVVDVASDTVYGLEIENERAFTRGDRELVAFDVLDADEVVARAVVALVDDIGFVFSLESTDGEALPPEAGEVYALMEQTIFFD